MGGRGTNYGGGGSAGGGGKGRSDNTPIYLANNVVGVTEKVTKTMGEENTKDAIQYIQDAITFITGNPDFMTLSIDGTASGNSYAHMRLLSGQMGVNTDYFKKNLTDLAKTYAADVRSGFHPKNTGMTDVFVHEAAHHLDAILGQRNGLKITDKKMLMSSTIVPEAIRNLKKAGVKGNTYEIQKALSRYGADHYKSHTGDNYAETFAEAIADYNRNKSKANVLSREIYKVMQKYL